MNLVGFHGGKEVVLVAAVKEEYTEGLSEKYQEDFNKLKSALDEIAESFKAGRKGESGPVFRVQRLYMGLSIREKSLKSSI